MLVRLFCRAESWHVQNLKDSNRLVPGRPGLLVSRHAIGYHRAGIVQRRRPEAFGVAAVLVGACSTVRWTVILGGCAEVPCLPGRTRGRFNSG